MFKVNLQLLIPLLCVMVCSKATSVQNAEEIVRVALAEAGESDPLSNALKNSMDKATMAMKMSSTASKTMVEENFIAEVKEIVTASGVEVILPLDCGRNPRAGSEDILDSSSAPFPWLVALGSKLSGIFIFQCVGALISESHVLTDGVCASSPTINVVQFNATSLPDMHVTENFIAGRKLHPFARSEEDFHHGINIGIIELAYPVQFDDFVQPICLPGIYDGGEEVLFQDDFNSTLIGFKDIKDLRGQRRGNLFSKMTISGYAPSCERVLNMLTIIPKSVVKTILSIISKDHMCVGGDFEESGRSLLVDLKEKSSTDVNRAVLLGIGPIANAGFHYLMFFTEVQAHRFWVNLIVRKFQRNTAMKKTRGR